MEREKGGKSRSVPGACLTLRPRLKVWQRWKEEQPELCFFEIPSCMEIQSAGRRGWTKNGYLSCQGDVASHCDIFPAIMSTHSRVHHAISAPQLPQVAVEHAGAFWAVHFRPIEEL